MSIRTAFATIVALIISLTAFAAVRDDEVDASDPKPQPKLAEEYAAIAERVSMKWISLGTTRPALEDPLKAAAAVAGLSASTEELEGARSDFAIVAFALSIKEHRADNPAFGIADAERLATEFAVSLPGKAKMTPKDLLEGVIIRGTKGAPDAFTDDLVGQTTTQHATLWDRYLFDVSEGLAGDDTATSPIRVTIVKDDTLAGGLRLTNASKSAFTNATLRIDSSIAGKDSQWEDYFIFVPKWEPKQEVLLPTEIVRLVLQRKPLEEMVDAIAYSLHCSELSATSVSMQLPRAEYEKVRGGEGPFTIELTSELPNVEEAEEKDEDESKGKGEQSGQQSPPPAPPGSDSQKKPESPEQPKPVVEAAKFLPLDSDAEVAAALQALRETPASTVVAFVIEKQEGLNPDSTKEVMTAIAARRESGGRSAAAVRRVRNGNALVALAVDIPVLVDGARIDGPDSNWCPPLDATKARSDQLIDLLFKTSRLERKFCQRMLDRSTPLSFTPTTKFYLSHEGNEKIAPKDVALSLDARLLQLFKKNLREAKSVDAAKTEILAWAEESRVGSKAKAPPKVIADPTKGEKNPDRAGETSGRKKASGTEGTPAVVTKALKAYPSNLQKLKTEVQKFDRYFRGLDGVWTTRHKSLRAVWRNSNSDNTNDGKTKTNIGRHQREIRKLAGLLITAAADVHRATDGSHASLAKMQKNIQALEDIRKAIETNDVALYERVRDSILSMTGA